MFTFSMQLADGTPADPPTFVSAVPNWNVGEPVMVGATTRYVILSPVGN